MYLRCGAVVKLELSSIDLYIMVSEAVCKFIANAGEG